MVVAELAFNMEIASYSELLASNIFNQARSYKNIKYKHQLH